MVVTMLLVAVMIMTGAAAVLLVTVGDNKSTFLKSCSCALASIPLMVMDREEKKKNVRKRGQKTCKSEGGKEVGKKRRETGEIVMNGGYE
jgi:hypothetical protein